MAAHKFSISTDGGRDIRFMEDGSFEIQLRGHQIFDYGHMTQEDVDEMHSYASLVDVPDPRREARNAMKDTWANRLYGTPYGQLVAQASTDNVDEIVALWEKSQDN